MPTAYEHRTDTLTITEYAMDLADYSYVLNEIAKVVKRMEDDGFTFQSTSTKYDPTTQLYTVRVHGNRVVETPETKPA